MGQEQERAVRSLRMVRSVTPNSAARFAVVSCRLSHRRSRIALRRSDGLTPSHLPPLLCGLEYKGKIGRFFSALEKILLFFKISANCKNTRRRNNAVYINQRASRHKKAAGVNLRLVRIYIERWCEGRQGAPLCVLWSFFNAMNSSVYPNLHL